MQEVGYTETYCVHCMNGVLGHTGLYADGPAAHPSRSNPTSVHIRMRTSCSEAGAASFGPNL